MDHHFPEIFMRLRFGIMDYGFSGSAGATKRSVKFPIIRWGAGGVRFANLSFLDESNLQYNGDSG